MSTSNSDVDERSPMDAADATAAAYRLIADCFVYPENLDRRRFVNDATREVIPAIAAHLDEGVADHLQSFIDDFESISPQEYVQTLELSPACPLYVGHYAFDDPSTCREIADADRNQYMVELAGIYEHFGFVIDDELPDFLPAMVEFLWLTRTQWEDPLREEYVTKLDSMLPGMIERFEAEETPYQHPLKALKRVIEHDLSRSAGGEG